MTKTNDTAITGSASALLKGFFAALLIMLIGAAATAILFSLTDVSIKILNMSHYMILALAFLISGFITGRCCPGKSLLHGIMLAVLSIIIIVIATAAGTEIMPLNAGLKSLIIFICAALGSIMGVH